MIHFIRYACEHHQKILAVYMRNEKMEQKTVSVLEYNDCFITMKNGRSKPFTIPIENLLSCGYARGDNGEGDKP